MSMSGRKQGFRDPVVNVDPDNSYTPRNQNDIEINFVRTYENCDVNILEEVIDKAGNLIPFNFKSLFTGDDLSSNTQKAISCVINGLKRSSEDPYLKKILKEFDKIGSGSFGAVFLTEGDFGPLFVIKKLSDEDNRRSIISLYHEAFVGLAAINQIRKETPGFIQTYGSIECGRAPKGQKLDERTWCTEGKKTTYLAIEPVSDVVTLQDFVSDRRITGEILGRILIQVESALNIAHKKFKFTHYDLHDSNVLIQKLPEEIYVPIYYRDRVFYLKTKYLARIIDYGMSFVEIDGKKFGLRGREEFFKYSHSYPIRDTFGLINCIYDTLSEKKEYLEESILSKVFLENVYSRSGRDLVRDNEFFETTPYSNAGIAYLGELEWSDELSQITHDQILSWINDALEDGFDKFLRDDLPDDGKVYNLDSRDWSYYDGKLFANNSSAEEESESLADSLAQLDELRNFLPQGEQEKLTEETSAIAERFIDKNKSNLSEKSLDQIKRFSHTPSSAGPQTSIFAPASSSRRSSEHGKLVFSSPEPSEKLSKTFDLASPESSKIAAENTLSVFAPSQNRSSSSVGRLTFTESPSSPVILGSAEARNIPSSPIALGSAKSPVRKSSLQRISERGYLSSQIGQNPDPLTEQGNDPDDDEKVERSEDEARALIGFNDCPVEITEDIKSHLDSLDIDVFTSLFELGKNPQDQRLQRVIYCLINALHETPNDPNLKTIIQKLSLLSAGSYGEVFLAKNKNVPLFVVKRSLSLDDTLDHEAFVGLMALNNIRFMTPAFIYTYGLFDCLKMKKNSDDSYSWCSMPNTRSDFLLIENLGSSKTLSQYIQSSELNYIELMKIIIQVVSGLNVAYKKFGFTHYDMHAANILIQELPWEVSVPIYIGTDLFYIKTHKLARIIDYGMSRIKIPGQNSYGVDKSAAAADYHGYPAHDLSVLLFNLIYFSGFNKKIDAKERDHILTSLSDMYGKLFKRSIADDIKYFAGKTRGDIDESYRRKKLLQKRLDNITEDLAIIERQLNIVNEAASDQEIREKMGNDLVTAREINVAPIVNKYVDMRRRGQINIREYLKSIFIEITEQSKILFDRIEKELAKYPPGSETVTFWNGYLTKQTEFLTINHDRFFEILIEVIGTDLLHHLLSVERDESIQSTICVENCKPIGEYRTELFGPSS